MFKILNVNLVILGFFLVLFGCNGKEEIQETAGISSQASDPHGLVQDALKKQNIGAFEEAIEILNKALEIDPQFVSAHYQLGRVYEEAEKRKKAMEAYRRALEIEPSNINARLGLASVYAKLNKNELAIEEYKKIAEIKKDDPEIHFKIALEYWYLQDIPKTAEHYRKVIEINPEHLQAHLNLASVYERMKDWENALKEIEIAKRLGKKTQNLEAVSIAERKRPFIKARMNLTEQDMKRKTEPPFN